MNSITKFFSGETSKRFHPYFTMWWMACLFGTVLVLTLFLRPTPYGPAYVMDVMRYMPHAIFYMIFGMSALTMPFLLASLCFKADDQHCKRQRIFRGICLAILTITLFYQHLDNEILRYCNMHITPDFLRTYLLNQGVPVALWDLLAEDKGGSNLSLILAVIPFGYLVCYLLLNKHIRIPQKATRWMQWALLGLITVCFVFLPAFLRTDLFGSKNRQMKVAPPLVLVRDAIVNWNDARSFPDDMSTRISEVNQNWKALDGSSWQLTDPARPWKKKFVGTCEPADKTYNFIIISFESFRAYSLNMFNPEQTVEATPYLNSMIKEKKASYYTNYYTNAHPTIGGFMAYHTGMLPHSRLTTAKSFTKDTIDSFINVFRRNGWQTSFFGGSDPDWDGQRYWLMKWYDYISFKPENDEADRLVMHDVANWLKTERDPSKPFVLTTYLISNHMPFHQREQGFEIDNGKELYNKIFNTMRYDDDVLKEFIESIQDEPWFDDTILVVTADHGLDLGDRGDAPDYNNLRTEAIQIPLVLFGKHPRLVPGQHDELASHVDLGSTLLDLAGLCPENSVMGHSLLTQNKKGREVFAFKDKRAAIRTDDWTAYILENDDVMLFEKNDRLQKNDVAQQHPEIAKKLRDHARNVSLTVDYAYQNDLLH